MSKFEFYYFEFKGLGEPIRLLLAYGGEDWKDNRLAREDWPAFKPNAPFGQLPMLVIDGKKYVQSCALARYLGRKHGLAGATLEEDLIIDQNLDFLNDLRSKLSIVRQESDEEQKAKKHEEFSKNLYPGMLEKLDQIIRENNGHLALGKLTWADFLFAGWYPVLKMMLNNPDLDEKYPSFRQLEQTVYSIPKVKAFADTAPKSEF